MTKSKLMIRMNSTLTFEQREYVRKQAYLADKNMSWVIRKLIDEKIKKENNE